MNEIFGYVYSVAVVSAVGGAVCAFIPFGSEKTEKFVRYVLSLAVLLLLISPLLSILGSNGFFNGDEIKKVTEQIVKEYELRSSDTRRFIISDGIENIEKRIGQAIAKRYSVPAEDIETVIETYDDGEMVYVTNIKITLGVGAFSLDTAEVSEYVSELCGCECDVNFK